MVISRIASAGGAAEPFLQYDFSNEYNHPGSPLMQEGPFGRSVLRRFNGDCMIWVGNGASEDGARPFIDLRDYITGAKKRRLWRGGVWCYESPEVVLGAELGRGGREVTALDRVRKMLRWTVGVLRLEERGGGKVGRRSCMDWSE